MGVSNILHTPQRRGTLSKVKKDRLRHAGNHGHENRQSGFSFSVLERPVRGTLRCGRAISNHRPSKSFS